MLWRALLLCSFTTLSAYSQVQAVRAYDLYDSVGVNTHWYYGAGYQYQSNFASLVKDLDAARIKHFRDGVYGTGTTIPPYLTTIYQTLADKGIRSDLIVPPSVTISQSQLDAALRLYPGIEAIEPPNEWDLNGGAAWVSSLLAEEPAIEASGHDLNLTVLGPALTQVGSYVRLGNVSEFIDFNNMHIYFGGRNPENGGWGGPDVEGNYYGSIPFQLDLANVIGPGQQSYATETGYLTTSGTVVKGQVPEWVAGTYVPRIVMEFFKRGVKRTYFYELIDDPNGNNSGYGLLRYDLSPKPSFTALVNLMGILQDEDTSFTPGSLQYALAGNTSGVESLLMQKSSGTYWLAIWLKGCIYDVNALTATPLNPRQLTLSIQGGRVATYTASFASKGSVQGSWPNATSLKLNVNSNLTMVRIAYFGK